jgi:uncharacterized DUF497 family protein
MLFEWDSAKSQRNLLERGFGFDHAATIFVGPSLEAQDNRRDYGEVRVQAIGRAPMIFYPSSIQIAAKFAASSQHGSPIERSANYGYRSSNTGTNPPYEAED